MAVKTFTTGEVLTASDTNTYLANAGLVYITSTTVASSSSAVVVTNCFSSTYDAYQIVVSGGAMSAGDYGLNLQLGSTTSGYYYAGYYITYGGANPFNLLGANGSNWGAVGIATTNGLNASIFLNNPYKASNTFFTANYIYNATGGGQGNNGGYLNNTTQYTGFTLSVGAGNFSGETIVVYGYRKA